MGVDICFFIDHDLPTDNAENFLKEFKKRINGEVILSDINMAIYTFSNIKKGIWHINYSSRNNSFESIFPNLNEGITLFYIEENMEIEVSLYKNVVDVFQIKINGKEVVDLYRWSAMVDIFSNKTDFSKEWINKIFEIGNKYLIPVFHSTELLLTADSSSYRHETIAYEYLMDDGMSIKDALEMNEKFESPCKVLYDDKSFGNSEDDYWDGDIGPLYIFRFPQIIGKHS